MKKTTVEIFAGLGRKMAAFGSDARTREVVRAAAGRNPWFMPEDVVRAAANIAETMLRPRELEKWLAAYPSLPVASPCSVLVIMAGNIPFAGFQDLLCVVASGHRAVVKMSSRDTAAMSYIIDELLSTEPSLPVSEYGGERVDALIAMGADDTVRDLRNRFAGITSLLRGSRSSLAVLSGGETPGQIDALAGDILSYSGLGCRSVSLLFVPEGFDMGSIAGALRAKSGGVNPKYLNNLRQTKALLAAEGAGFIDCGCCVLCEGRAFPTALSRINYTRYASPHEPDEWIAAHDDEIQCVAGNSGFSRPVEPGAAQKPSLRDYPDGRDTMEFLASI